MSYQIPQWVLSQKETFTNWANVVLDGQRVIQDIEIDFGKGLVLITLAEKLIGKQIETNYKQKPITKLQRLENTEIALNFLKSDGVKIINFNSRNIIEGDLRMLLGLLWTLIVKYHIGKNGQDASRNGLIEWVNQHLNGQKAEDMSNCWKNGELLCDLVNSIKNDTVDKEHELYKKGGIERIDFIQQMAKEKLNVPIVMPARLFEDETIDELCLMTYIAYFRNLN